MNGEKTVYVTGGTGLLGSHLVERLLAEGYRVRVLVRETSDTSFLETLDVELVHGDITDAPEELARGMGDATKVFHCAAYIDDWGPREKMVDINVGGLRNVLEAARAADVRRFVFLGSLAVYGGGDQVDLDESSPFVETGDNYNHTKIECERVLREFARETGLPAVSIRPPYVYGPRDRQLFPRVCGLLRDREWAYLSGGTVPFTLAYALNVVEACLLAATCDDVAGEAFIVTDDEAITRRELVEILCDEMGYERPTKSVPRGLAKALCPICEGAARLFHARQPPRLNRFRYKFAASHLTFDISKARRVLGYEPKYETRDSVRATARWFRENRTDLLPKDREHRK